MKWPSKVWYYLRSIGTLLIGIEQPVRTALIFLGWSRLLPGEIVLRRNGWRFKIRSPMDAWVIKETCLDQDYLWSTPVMGQNWNVIDVGAGLGDFTVFAAMNCPQGHVIACEPLDESYQLLEENVARNDVSNAFLFRAAVASVRDRFEIFPSSSGEAVSTRFQKGDSGEGEVPAIGLRELLDDLPGGECDFMKIDCEGCEYELLINSSAALLSRIHRISMEYHLLQPVNALGDLQQQLESAGFQVRVRDNPVHSTLGFLYAQRLPRAT